MVVKLPLRCLTLEVGGWVSGIERAGLRRRMCTTSARRAEVEPVEEIGELTSRGTFLRTRWPSNRMTAAQGGSGSAASPFRPPKHRFSQIARLRSKQQKRADKQIHRYGWIARFHFAAAGWNALSFHLRKAPHTYVPASGPQDRGRHFLHLYDSLDLFMKRHARQSGPSCLFCAEQPFDVRIHVVHSFHFPSNRCRPRTLARYGISIMACSRSMRTRSRSLLRPV